MAIIYSYPIATPQDTDLLIISRTPTDPDEISNYSVDMSSVADYVIDKAFNGTDRYIPRFDGTSSLVNSVIYENNSYIGIGTINPQKTLHVNGNALFTGAIEVYGTTFLGGPITCEDTINMTGNGRITNLEDPQDNQDAATKLYVDSKNTGQVTGTGTTNNLPKWTDGPNGVLSDSIVSELANKITINSGSLLVGLNNTAPGSYSMASGSNNNVLGNEAVALGFNNTVEGNRCGALGANNIVAGGQVWATGDGNDVGIEKLNVGGNIVTSGFNNTVKSGNSCAIGTGNILTNTLEEQSVNTNFALGSSNTLNDVTNVLSLGFNNTINNDKSYTLGKNNTTSANDTYAVGSNNTLSSEDDYAFGLNNTLSGSANIAMALGHNNILSGSQSYAFGRNLIDGGQNDTTIIGRYNTTPTATGRIVFGTGFSNTGRKNAIEIQAGDATQSGLLFPALRLSVSYNSDADAASAGVQSGELYRSNNQVKINTNQVDQDARNNEGLAFLTPRVKTLTQGEIFGYKTNYNILKLEFSGSGSSAEVQLPPASSVTNRVFRIVTGSSLIGKQINITVQGGGTINGVTNQILFNQYAGTAIWSDGVEYQFVP